jgi:glycine C-acetyltransferase/8-amino-7-oxononanoate synthase
MTDFSMTSPVGPRVMVAGRERDYFSGTGYLGLQNHPMVVQAATDCITRYGLSTATSRGGYGEHPVYAALDAELRAFFAVDGVLVLASGYLGAVVLCQGLQNETDHIFVDAAAHFSVLDAARAAGKPVHQFPHLDVAGLQKLLQQELHPKERPLVMTDGVFPISGEICPLPGLLAAVEPYQGRVLLDDAHAVGVLGAHGRGTPDHFDLINRDQLVGCATLSKALGGYGGIIPGSRELLNHLERVTRVYVAASPPPLPSAAAAACALGLARQQPELRQRLWQNVRQARSGLRALGWPLADTPVPILCLGVRPGVDLGRIKDALFDRDICVAHVRNYSSTPPGGALRIAISASHTTAQIERLVFETASLL